MKRTILVDTNVVSEGLKPQPAPQVVEWLDEHFIERAISAITPTTGKLADLQIAGIASAYGLQLATRNQADFAGLGLELIDPWSR